MPETPTSHHQSDPKQRERLRWRARRGMLENDLVLTRFLDAYETELTDGEVAGLTRLLELSDNDLMDLFLDRKPVDTSEFDEAMREVLAKIKAL